MKVKKFLIILTFFTLISCFSIKAQELEVFMTVTRHYGFKNKTGKVVIPARFVFAREFSEGLACVTIEVNGKWLSGFINKLGNYVIKPQFFNLDSFTEGLAPAGYEYAKWGYIDKTGKFVIQPQFEYAYCFSEGLACVKKDNKNGYIDKTGKFVIQPKFVSAWTFSEGYASAHITDGEGGYIDKTGKFVIQPIYRVACDFKGGVAQVTTNNGKEGFIDKAGELYSSENEAREGSKYIPKDNESYNAYMARVMPSWKDYLKQNGAITPKLPSNSSMKETIETEINAWQKKDEFETTATWQERVTESTRNAKIDEIIKRIIDDYDNEYSSYKNKVAQLKKSYEERYKNFADKYCRIKARKFALQEFVLNPYDADNQTFTISSNSYKDILLNVPLDKAPQFKSGWDRIKLFINAEYVPTGNDIALKSVTFGKYKYNNDITANYVIQEILFFDMQTDPIIELNIDKSSLHFDPISI
jgi:uncharacterized protein YihD (DUF1040 family)